jgi:hypothetical protein
VKQSGKGFCVVLRTRTDPDLATSPKAGVSVAKPARGRKNDLELQKISKVSPTLLTC